MPLIVRKVGHVVLRVRDLETSLSFYCGVLGLLDVARRDFGEGPMAFLSTGHAHHDIALVEARDPASAGGALHHFALKIGDSLDDLAHAATELESAGVAIHMTLDHRVSQGIYVSDPDGNLIELYVDVFPEAWRADPSLVANSDPLSL